MRFRFSSAKRRQVSSGVGRRRQCQERQRPDCPDGSQPTWPLEDCYDLAGGWSRQSGMNDIKLFFFGSNIEQNLNGIFANKNGKMLC